MATTPEVLVTETRIGDGKTLGATGKSATLGAAGGGAIGTILAYLLMKIGFESDPTVAALIGGALATAIGPIVTAISAKLTPSTGGIERTTKVQIPHTEADPEGPVAGGVPLDSPVAEAPVNGYDGEQGTLDLESVGSTTAERLVAGAPASVAPRHRAVGE